MAEENLIWISSSQGKKRKLQKSWEKARLNDETVKRLKKIHISEEGINYNKKERKIRLLDRRAIFSEIAGEEVVVDYMFNNLPFWVIKFIYPYTIFETESAFVVNENLIYTVTYEWKQIAGDYRFRAYIGGRLDNELPDGSETTVQAPLFATLELAILNGNVWHEIQQKRV